LLATYQANPKTTVRLLFNERAGTTNLAFAPNETRLTLEPNILFRGVPRTSRVVEVDVERYLGNRGFLKLFAFRAVANDLALGGDAPVYAFNIAAPFTLGQLEQTGVGARYEQQLSRHLFGQIGVLANRTTNRTPGQSFDGKAAPYYPNYTASFALNYIGTRGNKATLIANHFGSFYQDRPDLYGLPPSSRRERFGAQTYVTILLAREASLNQELFVGVSNLFNRSGILFNDVPAASDAFGGGRRRVFAGVTRRF
jgi:hypothetical protein